MFVNANIVFDYYPLHFPYALPVTLLFTFEAPLPRHDLFSLVHLLPSFPRISLTSRLYFSSFVRILLL